MAGLSFKNMGAMTTPVEEVSTSATAPNPTEALLWIDGSTLKWWNGTQWTAL